MKRFEIKLTKIVSHIVCVVSLMLSAVRALEPLRGRFGEFQFLSCIGKYNSKSKTGQNGFVMALEVSEGGEGNGYEQI